MKGKFKRANQKILNDPGVKDCLRKLHEDFVLVPADKAVNNVIVICKTNFIETIIKELVLNSLDKINSTYVPSSDYYEKILRSHSDFVKSVGFKLPEEDQDLPLFVLDSKLHRTPFKQRFSANDMKILLSCLKVLENQKHCLLQFLDVFLVPEP